jgi:hypothetical protein
MMEAGYMPKGLSEALGWLIEEAAEVQSEVGKTIRFGLWSWDPREPVREYNRDAILRELGDLKAAIHTAEAWLTKEVPPA